jgi:transposase
MRFYNGQHRHWCGIDLHAKTMYVCILDAQGQALFHKNLPATPEAFLETVEPYREGLAAHFPDPAVRKSIALDLALLERYDELITDLELDLARRAKQHDPQAFQRLRSIPGVGKVMALTILYEVHDVHRFDRVQQFASYARLVRCAKESGGKKLGTGGAKMGNVYLKWAFSEAAVLFVRHSAEGRKILARLEKRFGKGKAFSSWRTRSDERSTTCWRAARHSTRSASPAR